MIWFRRLPPASKTSSNAQRVDDRAALYRVAAEACRAGPVRWATRRSCCSTCRSIRGPKRIWSRRCRAAPTALATIPDGDTSPGAQLLACAAGRRADGAEPAALRSLAAAPLRVPTERPPERERAGDVRLFSAPGEGREAVEIVRRVLDEAARGVPFDEMAVFLRAPQQYLGLLEHACARGGVPVYFDRGTRRPDPAGRAFVALLSCARRRTVGEAIRRVPVARSGAAGRPTATPSAGLASSSPRDEVLRRVPSTPQRPVATTIPSRSADVPPSRLRRRRDRRRHAAIAVEVGGADRRIGGRRRPHARGRQGALAAAARRPGRRLSHPDRRARRATSRSRRASRGSSATCAISTHLRAFALPIIDELAEWPERAHVGRVARPLRALAPRAAPARRACCRRSPICGRWPTSGRCRSKRRATSCTIAWSRSTGSRRRAATAALFVGTPHQARGRTLPRRLRAGAGRARRAAAAARGSAAARRARRDARRRRSSRQDDARQRRAPAAEDRDRRGDRAAVSVVSAARRRRDARARAVVLRARRRCARSPAACPIIACSPRRRPRKPARASRGRRRPIPIARSTTSSTTSPC